MLKVADELTPRLVALHVTTPDAFVQPGEAETKTAPAGRVSMTATLVATSGPLLVAVSEYVLDVPAVTVEGPEPDSVRALP
jgi:hypothetical protein